MLGFELDEEVHGWEGVIEVRYYSLCYIILDILLRPAINPKKIYGDKFTEDLEVKKGLRLCMCRMIPDEDERALADCELDAYREKLGEFGTSMAQKTISNRTPGINLLVTSIFIL